MKTKTSFKKGHAPTYTTKGKGHHQYRHGMFRTRPYGIYSGIKRRCYNKNDSAYPRYGAVGVKMCNEWRDSFMAFWEDMKGSYFDEATIDRIDNSKGYSKENCRWVTKLEQARNKKSVVLYEYKGQKYTIVELEKKYGFKDGTIRNRLKNLNWSVEQAVETKTSYGNKYRNYKKKN